MGEMTVTLEDVGILWGLPLRGTLILLNSHSLIFPLFVICLALYICATEVRLNVML
jgi:hypothetical protein